MLTVVESKLKKQTSARNTAERRGTERRGPKRQSRWRNARITDTRDSVSTAKAAASASIIEEDNYVSTAKATTSAQCRAARKKSGGKRVQRTRWRIEISFLSHTAWLSRRKQEIWWLLCHLLQAFVPWRFQEQGNLHTHERARGSTSHQQCLCRLRSRQASVHESLRICNETTNWPQETDQRDSVK